MGQLFVRDLDVVDQPGIQETQQGFTRDDFTCRQVLLQGSHSGCKVTMLFTVQVILGLRDSP